MKIWSTELALIEDEDGNYNVRFTYQLEKYEYEVNEHVKNEWICRKGWYVTLPMQMTLKRFYDSYRVIQSFDHELSKKELKKIETDMRKLMKQQLDYDKEAYLKRYEKKAQVI